jgi:3-hydroxyacyl-CoA dehydrogenase
MRVLVTGAGLMGAQIGCEYAIGGHTVRLVARDVAAARERAEEGLESDRLGLIASEPRADVRARVTITAEPDPDCDLVIESLPEDFDLEVAVLRPLATSARNAMIATNTSSLGIKELGNEIGAPERTVGTHYWNPPLVMPLVEVVAGAGPAALWSSTFLEPSRGSASVPSSSSETYPGFV